MGQGNVEDDHGEIILAQQGSHTVPVPHRRGMSQRIFRAERAHGVARNRGTTRNRIVDVWRLLRLFHAGQNSSRDEV